MQINYSPIVNANSGTISCLICNLRSNTYATLFICTVLHILAGSRILLFSPFQTLPCPKIELKFLMSPCVNHWQSLSIKMLCWLWSITEHFETFFFQESPNSRALSCTCRRFRRRLLPFNFKKLNQKLISGREQDLPSVWNGRAAVPLPVRIQFHHAQGYDRILWKKE